MPEPDNDHAALRDFLATHDATCPLCDHGLRSVPEPRCPECGAPLHLAVASVQTSPGPWLLAICSWTLALGFDSVVALFMTIGVVVARPPLSQGYPYIFVATFLTLSVASAIGLLRVIRARPRWNAKPRRAQWRDAGITFVSVAALHAAVGATILVSG